MPWKASTLKPRGWLAPDKRRLSAAQRGYGRPWKKARDAFLALNPNCIRCGRPATVADHVTPRQELVVRGVTDPDAHEFLQPLCRHCHAVKTAVNDGRWGR